MEAEFVHHTTGKMIQYDKEEYRRRHSDVPDLTEQESFTTCKA